MTPDALPLPPRDSRTPPGQQPPAGKIICQECRREFDGVCPKCAKLEIAGEPTMDPFLRDGE